MEELIKKIQEKKEFLEIPRSIILRVLELKEIKSLDEEEQIKNARAFLRKYFSVFMTNKLVSGKLGQKEILEKHISTKNRNYEEIYARITGNEDIIIDLGAGLNGFSYNYFKRKLRYIAIEAIRIFVKIMNEYFEKNKINGIAVQEDLLDLNKIIKIIENKKGKKVIFLFNVIDALERVERDYSKKLLIEIGKLGDKIVLSFPTQSLTGKSRFKAKRYWLLDFLEKNFSILDDFEMRGERFLAVGSRDFH
jgi:hypothetical protein